MKSQECWPAWQDGRPPKFKRRSDGIREAIKRMRLRAHIRKALKAYHKANKKSR